MGNTNDEEQDSRSNQKSFPSNGLQNLARHGTNHNPSKNQNHSSNAPQNTGENVSNPNKNATTGGLGNPPNTSGGAEIGKDATATSAGASGAGATGAGATGAGAGSAGAATGAGAGSAGAAAGAAAGSALGKGATNTIKGASAPNQSNTNPEMSKSSFSGSKDEKSINEDGTVLKVIIILSAILITVVLLIASTVYVIFNAVAAPAMMLFTAVKQGATLCSEFISDIGKDNPSFEEIVSLLDDKMAASFQAAYTDVCQREILQICKENEYDINLTFETYQNTEFPYILNGDNCNINYSEIMNIISMSKEYEDITYKTFDYNGFCDLLKNDEFRRCLYNLDVKEREKKVINYSAIPNGYTADVDDEGNVTITDSNGNSETYSGEEASTYYTIIKYGEVSISHYSLKEIYDYFDIDPYAKNEEFPALTNEQALERLDYFTRAYYPNSNWGDEARTPLWNYTRYTGELTTTTMDIYYKDLNKKSSFSDTRVYMDVEVFKQSGESWSSETYGSGTISNLGCCLVSMAMVCNYFYPETIDPHELNQYIKETNDGLLNRSAVAKHYGISELKSTVKINLEEMMGELRNERLIIAHVRAGSHGSSATYGHFVVLNGYNCTEGDTFFYVCDPARGMIPDGKISMAEAVMTFDSYQSYGKNGENGYSYKYDFTNTSSSIINLDNYNVDVQEDIANGYYTAEDYTYMLAVISSEAANTYESAVAVGYCVLNRVAANKMSIKDVVTANGQFASPWPSYLGKKPKSDIIAKATVAVLKREVENPIGDCYFFFGSYAVVCVEKGAYYKTVGGNVYYRKWGDVHTYYKPGCDPYK